MIITETPHLVLNVQLLRRLIQLDEAAQLLYLPRLQLLALRSTRLCDHESIYIFKSILATYRHKNIFYTVAILRTHCICWT